MSRYAELRVEDGEIGDPTDINDVSRLMSARLHDILFGQQARTGELNLGTADSVLFALGAGAFPVPSGSARTIEVTPGTIMQPVGNGAAITGAAPGNLFYYLAGGELSFVVAAGDATNPRIDLLCVKLSELADTARVTDAKDATNVDTTQNAKTRLSTILASQVVAGTPAGSPTAPATPAGWAVLAQVRVPATFNAVVSVDNLYDRRVPLGTFERPSVMGYQGYGVAGWAGNADGDLAASANPAIAYFPCPLRVPAMSRLITVGLTAKLAAGATVRLWRRDLGALASPPTDTLIRDLTSLITLPLNGFVALDFAIATANVPPVWGNGYPCGPAALNAGASGRDSQLVLQVVSGANTDLVRRVTWGAPSS